MGTVLISFHLPGNIRYQYQLLGKSGSASSKHRCLLRTRCLPNKIQRDVYFAISKRWLAQTLCFYWNEYTLHMYPRKSATPTRTTGRNHNNLLRPPQHRQQQQQQQHQQHHQEQQPQPSWFFQNIKTTRKTTPPFDATLHSAALPPVDEGFWAWAFSILGGGRGTPKVMDWLA